MRADIQVSVDKLSVCATTHASAHVRVSTQSLQQIGKRQSRRGMLPVSLGVRYTVLTDFVDSLLQ